MRSWLRRVPWVLVLALILALAIREVPSHPKTPAWCSALPRPEYKPLERVSVSDPWFEVYRVVPGVFAIYEPHQAEEVISYLIAGTRQAALFDTGMGISDIQRVTAELTKLPIVVLNSHTHIDHVGGNWRDAQRLSSAPVRRRPLLLPRAGLRWVHARASSRDRAVCRCARSRGQVVGDDIA
jgi:hypothetical protein